jgi:hypothetical protein
MKMFISELINGRYYYVAEGPDVCGLRWSIVPHAPEPITKIDRVQVPVRIREQCQRMFDNDSRRRYNERKSNEVVLCTQPDFFVNHIGYVGVSAVPDYHPA